ncbi:MAG: hypothetical protein ACM3MK_02040 [Chitinophagales bacterium]
MLLTWIGAMDLKNLLETRRTRKSGLDRIVDSGMARVMIIPCPNGIQPTQKHKYTDLLFNAGYISGTLKQTFANNRWRT